MASGCSVTNRRKYVTFGLQVNCHCCTIVYQNITQLIETHSMEFYFNSELKYRRNMSDKIKRGVKLGEKHGAHEIAKISFIH